MRRREADARDEDDEGKAQASSKKGRKKGGRIVRRKES